MPALGPDGRPATFAECMEITADFLDTLHRSLEVIGDLTGREVPEDLGGRMMQQDLKAVAAHLTEHPDLDAKLMEFIRGGVQEPADDVG